MNAQTILQMSNRALFPSKAEIEKRFRELAREWHPDRNKDPLANQVMAHISALHAEAKARALPPSQEFIREDGTKFKMEYLRHLTAEGMDIYVGESSIAYVVGKSNEDLANRASARKWVFSKAMEKDFKPLFPNPHKEIRLNTARMFIYRRNKDQVLLRELMNQDGKIEGPHVAWMISRMINLVCFLEYSKVAHLALAPEFLLVSPEQHSMALVGPTLFAQTIGKRPIAAPKRTIEIVPRLKSDKTMASPEIDLQLVRDIGLHLLGDPSGNRLSSDPTVRPEIAKWLNSHPAASAFEDMEAWDKSLGPRKFVKYPKVAGDYYEAA